MREGFEIDTIPNPLLPEGVSSLRTTQALDFESHPDDVLADAAQMAVCWSRAWASGGRAATAFHAAQGQVSKTTESGESLEEVPLWSEAIDIGTRTSRWR